MKQPSTEKHLYIVNSLQQMKSSNNDSFEPSNPKSIMRLIWIIQERQTINLIICKSQYIWKYQRNKDKKCRPQTESNTSNDARLRITTWYYGFSRRALYHKTNNHWLVVLCPLFFNCKTSLHHVYVLHHCSYSNSTIGI
jgi:hypothetical protein